MPNSDPDPDDYNPAGPVRTFMAKVQFVNAGPMPPMKVEFPMTETTDPDDLSIPEIKDAILCKLVSMAMEFAVDDRDKDDLAKLVSAWANAND